MYKYADRDSSTVAMDAGKQNPFFSPNYVQTAATRDPSQNQVASDSFQADTKAPAKLPDWSPDDITITVKSNEAKCLGTSSRSGGQKMSRCQPSRFCTTPAQFTFHVWFHFDVDKIPRPLPFTDADVSVDLSFTPDGEKTPIPVNSGSGIGVYDGPGNPLKTPFGNTFSFSTGKDGVLHIEASMKDSQSGLSLSYVDDVQCTIIPCS